MDEGALYFLYSEMDACGLASFGNPDGMAAVARRDLSSAASLEPVPVTDPHVVQAFVLVVAKTTVREVRPHDRHGMTLRE